jgi:hypothetical protein
MNPYLKYSGMAFQLILFLLAGFFGGKYLAHWLGWDEKVFSAVGMLIFLSGGLFSIVRNLLKENP